VLKIAKPKNVVIPAKAGIHLALFGELANG
jgi:hypothetical protein